MWVSINYDPSKVALGDSGYDFVIDMISDTEGDPKSSKYQLLLFFKLHGKDFKKITLEPWKNLRSTDELNSYLKASTDKYVRMLLKGIENC